MNIGDKFLLADSSEHTVGEVVEILLSSEHEPQYIARLHVKHKSRRARFTARAFIRSDRMLSITEAEFLDHLKDES